MMNQKKRDWYGSPLRLLTVLVIGLLAVGLMPLGAADVSVTRDLPDEPVYPGTQIMVTLNQTGFLLDIGIVWESLPDGFTYMGIAPGSGGEYMDYDLTSNSLTLGFRDKTTVQYLVETGTADQIEDAVFSGTWKTLAFSGDEPSGDIQGDSTLTLGTGPKPMPTSPPPPTHGGELTPAPSNTASPSESPGTRPTVPSGPTASPGATPMPVSPTPTPGSTLSPTASPTAKTGITGFELSFAIAGLLAVAQRLWRRRS